MSPLALAVLARNARFRAWKAAGIPVTGAWEYAEADEESSETATLQLTCEVCQIMHQETVLPYRYENFQPVLRTFEECLAALEDRELTAVCCLSGARSWSRPREPCDHVLVLGPAENDPSEVKAIFEMELLSGG